MFALKTRRRKSGSSTATAQAGQAKRDRENKRGRIQSASVRDIGPIPEPADLKRRNSTEFDFRPFCSTYFPHVFYFEWSKDHLKAIAKTERAMLMGALFALAMPRGSGKTVLAFVAAMWAELFGHRRFVSILAATDKKAQGILTNIKTAFRTNDLLAADFPEVCIAIRALEDDARRCKGQLCQGERTNITWTNTKVILPTINVPWGKSSASILTVCGLTGSIRGQNHTLPTGEIIRPDFALVDDPQDRESAYSDSQCEQRVAILSGDVLGMAGPGKKIAGMMPCTVIRAGDMADRILDRQQHPDWQGERCKMVYAFPTDTAKWEEYAKLRIKSLDADGTGSEATEYYRQNQEAMDAGADVPWAARFDKDEISAVQNAMNLKLRDEASFFAEYQNDPKTSQVESVMLKPEQIMRKLNGLARIRLPIDVQKMTAMIDVHDDLLYYAAAGFAIDSTGYVADYGTWPDQNRRYFTKREAGDTMQKRFAGAGKEGAIFAGLESLIGDLFAKVWMREDGTALPLDRVFIDLGYAPDTVYQVIRLAARGSTIMGSRGVGITASAKPIAEYPKRPGELYGNNWLIPLPKGRESRHIRFDSNFWKSWVHDRFGLAKGDKGSMSLYGSEPQEHRMFADHLVAEFFRPTEGNGRKLKEWRERPNHPDNHLLDCVVGCSVAASTCGCGQHNRTPPPPRRQAARVSYL